MKKEEKDTKNWPIYNIYYILFYLKKNLKIQISEHENLKVF